MKYPENIPRHWKRLAKQLFSLECAVFGFMHHVICCKFKPALKASLLISIKESDKVSKVKKGFTFGMANQSSLLSQNLV